MTTSGTTCAYGRRTAIDRLALRAPSHGRKDTAPFLRSTTSCETAIPPRLDPAALYPEFAPLVSRLVRQYGDDPQMREDLVGEIYFRFAAFVAAYDPERGIPLRAYLVDQLTLSVFNWARARRRDRGREASIHAQSAAFATSHAVDPTSDWDHALATERIAAALPAAIEALPGRQRCVLIWRYYEQRSFEDIAGIMGIQSATARSLLRNALNNLRRWAAQNGFEWEQR